MTTAQVVETSVTVNNNIPIKDYVHPDDQTQPTFSLKWLLGSNLSAQFIEWTQSQETFALKINLSSF